MSASSSTSFHWVPGGKGMPTLVVQLAQAVEGQAASVLQQGDEDAHAGIVFFTARVFGKRCGKELATQVAAQLLTFVDLGLHRHLRRKADHRRGADPGVNRALSQWGQSSPACSDG